MLDPTGIQDATAVLSYDNIAIVIQFLVIIGMGKYIYFLTRGILSVKDALANVDKTLAVLNERLNHHATDD